MDLKQTCDFEAVTEKYEEELLEHWVEWEPRFAEDSDSSSTSFKNHTALLNSIKCIFFSDSGLHCKYRIELLRL